MGSGMMQRLCGLRRPVDRAADGVATFPGVCAVLNAHAARTCAPWFKSSFQTLSKVSELAVMRLRITRRRPGRTKKPERQRRRRRHDRFRRCEPSLARAISSRQAGENVVYNFTVLIVVVKAEREDFAGACIVNQNAGNFVEVIFYALRRSVWSRRVLPLRR